MAFGFDNQNTIFSAIELRDICGYLPIPYRCMVECKSAARLMGGLYALRVEKQPTLFWKSKKYAEVACVPSRSVFRHLRKLHEHDWISRVGRPKHRRTATIIFTTKALRTLKEDRHGALPRWFPSSPWSAAAVYAVIFSRACLLECQENNSGDLLVESGDAVCYSVAHFARTTGLSPRSVKNGIDWLLTHGFVTREVHDGRDQAPAEFWLEPPKFLSSSGRETLETPPENLALTPGKSGTHPPEKVALTPRKNGICNEPTV